MAEKVAGTEALQLLINWSKSTFSTKESVPKNLSDFTDDLGNAPVHTHNQYLTKDNLEFITSDLYGVKEEPYNPLNGSPIVLYNSDTNKKEIVACEDYNLDDYPKSIYTPIGVVVIPRSHTKVILGEENAVDIMMSIKHMNYSTPDVGGAAQYMCWGYNGLDIPELFNYTKAPAITNAASGTPGEESGIGEDPTLATSYPRIPSDKFGGVESQACPGTYYSGTPYCPSPFLLQNGVLEPNPAYYLPWDDASPSVTSDFNGKSNTDIILSKITVSGWQSASTITNSSSTGNYPAVACCWRYSTPGTNQGDWYLPAAGELGYLIPFFTQHNKALTTINNVYGSGTALLLYSSGSYWSSSEYVNYNVYRLTTDSGLVGYNNRSNRNYVVAFCAVNNVEEPKESKFYTKEETDLQIATQINQLVDNAPETLDTLKELADAIGENKEILDVLKELKLSENYQPAEEGLESLEPQPGDTIEVAIGKLHKAITLLSLQSLSEE